MDDSVTPREREELSAEEIADRLAAVEVGDTVLFNDQEVPLKVVAVDADTVRVVGSEGEEYGLLRTGTSYAHSVVEGADAQRLSSLWWVEVVGNG